MAHYYVVRQNWTRRERKIKYAIMVFQLRAGGFQRKSWLIWLPIVAR